MKNTDYLACIILGIIGDKIGFKNGEREFFLLDQIPKYNSPTFNNKISELSIYMILDFLASGGITSIDTNELIYSDDSIMMLCNLKVLLDNYIDLNDFLIKLKNEYLRAFDNEIEMINIYKAGIHTISSIRLLKTGIEWEKRQYEKTGGGSGGSMRSAVFGLVFNYKNNLLELIKYSISSCAITHMNGIAFLGSFINAYFTSMAIDKVDIEKWIFNLIDLLNIEKNNIIDDYIFNTYPHIYEYYKKDKQIIKDKINIYIEDNFIDYNYQVNKNRELNQGTRILYYYENFSSNKNIFFPGSASDDSILFAYDCLLMSKNNYEKLIYFSMIHLGDSDTTGIIASNWYGALYSFKNVPKNLYKKYNEYNKINENINILIKKFK